MAALAMLALAVQLLIPAAAMAQGQPASMVLCTSKGLVTVTLDAGGDHHPAKGFGGLACQDCLASSLASLAAAPPVMIPVPVARLVAPVTAPLTAAEPRAQAPPRPPSQGPPTSIPA